MVCAGAVVVTDEPVAAVVADDAVDPLDGVVPPEAATVVGAPVVGAAATVVATAVVAGATDDGVAARDLPQETARSAKATGTAA